jgi:ParB-like chromosome segregation protein Spo0J
MKVDFHEAADIFPLDEKSIDALAADIAREGQHESIKVMAGKILDGRRRYLACQKVGISPRLEDVSPDDPVAYVISWNLHRRHLTPAQAAMAGARARAIYDRQAKERQKAAAVQGNKSRAGKGSPVPANLPEPGNGDARDQAGKALGVSGKTIDHATLVLKHGIPELAKAVDEGRMAVSTAAILASEPQDVQRREVNSPKRKRTYKSNGCAAVAEREPTPEERKRSKGLELANEAIDCLKRIPKNDAFRKRGFQLVKDWIRHNP